MKVYSIKDLVFLGVVWSVAGVAANAVTKADNTQVNARDDKSPLPTADQQIKGSKEDVEMTRLVRRALMKDDSLSTYAQNIKIITLEGHVTLRGPVKTADEKMKVASLARKAVGRQVQIANDLDIAQ